MHPIETIDRRIPRSPVTLMWRVYKFVLPEVKNRLAQWRKAAERIPDRELRTQALASIETKQFHCQGGAIYASANLPERHILIPLIVAFQTISDYLDNLCDRSTSMDGDDFRQLHLSMLDAVTPDAPLHPYYKLHPEHEDGGYLEQLVQTCRECIRCLPAYSIVQEPIRELVALYCDLQVYKHIRHDRREQELLAWWEQHQALVPELRWNEFAAATGSTLGVFMLFLAATSSELTASEVEHIKQAYFPYICGLHILLDYLIDQEEDRLGGDLNFCFYYDHPDMTVNRIGFIAEQARNSVKILPVESFHRMVIEGLMALYLSDPKVVKQQSVRAIRKKLMKNSPLTRMFFWMNSIWIRKLF